MSKPFLRVIKVGGSLFDLPDLGKRFQAWHNRQTRARTIVIAGGGPLVEELHVAAVRDNLSEREAHWQAIMHMNLNARWLAHHALGLRCNSSLSHYYSPHWIPHVLVPEKWLRSEEPNSAGTPLPESWDVTSDSIAARLAICINADELVLLKSAEPPSRDLQDLSNVGYIDKFFPKLAGELPSWRIVNLRSFKLQ